MTRSLAALFVLLLAACSTVPEVAPEPPPEPSVEVSPLQSSLYCNEYGYVRERLEVEFGELLIGRGVTSTGGLALIFSTPSGSTYTWVLLTPLGLACIISVGVSWEGIVHYEGPPT